MTKTPVTWMQMLEPIQHDHRGPIQMRMRAAHGWPDRLPECCGPDLDCHPWEALRRQWEFGTASERSHAHRRIDAPTGSDWGSMADAALPNRSARA